MTQRHGRAAWLLVASLVAWSCDGSCRRDESSSESASAPRKRRATPASSASSAPPGADERVPWCIGDERDLGLATTYASQGDLFVLRYADNLDDATILSRFEDLRTRALEHGARRAEVFGMVQTSLASNQTGLVVRVGYGLVPAMFESLAPRLASGRLPTDSEEFEIVLAAHDARALQLAAGDRIWIQTTANAWLEARMVGTLTTSTLWLVGERNFWTTPAQLRKLGPADVTGLAVFLNDRTIPDSAKEELAHAFGKEFHVMTFAELQQPIVLAARAMKPFCAIARRTPPPPPRKPPQLPRCSDRAALASYVKELRALIGDGDLVFDLPQPEVELTRAAPSLLGRDARHALFFQSILFSHHDMFEADIWGWTPESLTRLEPHVIRGKLSDVTPDGGIVLPVRLAVALGVDAGDRVQLSVQPTPTSPPVPFETTVAAVMSLSLEPNDTPLSSAWVHYQFAAHLYGVPKGSMNTITVWSRVDGTPLWSEPGPGIRDVRHPDFASDIERALESFCKAAR